MKAFIITLLLFVLFSSLVYAQGYHRVRPYFRSNGTYVQPHYRTNPDGNRLNNWSTYPNVNPFTGKTGTKRYDPYNYGY